MFTEPVAAAFQIPAQISIRSNDRVIVLGDGRLGNLCAQVLARQTNHLTVVGKHPQKLALLKALGISTAVVSDAPRLPVWLRICGLGLQHYFDAVITSDDAGFKKPHEKPFLMALERLGTKPPETIMIGDWAERVIDWESAAEPVASLLNIVWRQDESRLRQNAKAFTAFQNLLRWLADRQNALALELVGRLGRLM